MSADIRKRTARLVPLVPPDRIEWRPAPGAMSFGDLLRHLAGTERWMWAENVAGTAEEVRERSARS